MGLESHCTTHLATEVTLMFLQCMVGKPSSDTGWLNIRLFRIMCMVCNHFKSVQYLGKPEGRAKYK